MRGAGAKVTNFKSPASLSGFSGRIPLLPQEKATVPHICGVNGSKIGFDYVISTATATYYYIYNLQGDVIAIVDINNTTTKNIGYEKYGRYKSLDKYRLGKESSK